MDFNIKPWPKTSTIHELYSLVDFLSQYPQAPVEIRTREIESAFQRPMIQLTPLTSRVENRSRFDFSTIKTLALTYFGSDESDPQYRHNEAWIAADWLSEAFGRGYGVNGPIIPIKDFSNPQEAVETGDWMEVEEATASPVMDKFNLWTVPVDITYGVSRAEAEFEKETPPMITEIKWRVELQI